MKIQEVRRIVDSLPFRALIEQLREVFWVASEDARQIYYVSPSFREVWGRPCDTLYDDPAQWRAAIVPEDRPRVEEGRTRDAARDQYAVEYRIHRPDGAERWIAERGHWVWDESTGGSTLLVGLCEDITARKQRETRKEEFIAQAAHGLRSPLMGIKTAIDNLQSEDMQQWTPLQVRSVVAVARGVDRLTHLVHNLLDLARLESGEAILRRKLLGLPPYIEEALEIVEGVGNGPQLARQVECAADLPLVSADPEMLQQLLVNLAANGARFAKSRITVRGKPVNGGVQISVIDDGPGIPPEAMPMLFHKFGQLSRDRAEGGYKGSGLGLAICKQIVTLHGGLIWAESTAGAGAAFHVFLPTASQEK